MIREMILLVEDDLAVSKALAQALRVHRYGVVAAVNRQEALSELARHPIDICLLDLILGPDRGWETFHHLSHLRPDLPIIVMSAQPDQFFHRSACFAAGLLEKPFDVSVLFKRLAAMSAHPARTLTQIWAPKVALAG